MRVRVPIVLLVVSLSVAGLPAQAKPDLSGEWTLVLEKSDFGQMTMPTKMTRVISHKEPTLKIVTSQSTPTGDTRVETTFSTDGKPQQNSINGSDMTTIGAWQGATLVLKSTIKAEGGDVTIEDRYVLSDAGKTLTLTRNLTSPQGATIAKMSMIKK